MRDGEMAGTGSFLLMTLAISAIFYTLVIVSGHLGGAGGAYVAGLMWAPALAALATIRLRRLDMASLGLGRWDGRCAWIGYLVPLGYAAAGYAIIWTTGLGGFGDPAAIAPLADALGLGVTAPELVIPLYVLLAGTTGMIRATAYALGEEIGWRGFLTPRLVARFGFTGGSVLTGLIWATWHMPILLFADYNAGTPRWFAMPCFYALVMSSSVMLTWLRLRSASVWPCALMHASHNLFIQGVFAPLTSARGAVTPYAVGEFGFVVPLVVAGVALVFWWRRDMVTGGPK